MGFGKNNTGVILRDTYGDAIGALNAGTAVKIGATALEEDFRLIKAEILASIIGLQSVEVECLILGICDNELSNQEIEDCLKGRVMNRNDHSENEVVNRPVFPIAVQQKGHNATSVLFHEDGKPAISKKRWTYSNDDGFSLFVYNGGSQNLTNGATLRGIATFYGVWVS